MSYVALAQTCCSGGVPISANVGMPVTNNGKWQMALNYDINVLRTFKAGDRTLNDDTRERRTHSALWSIGYNISKRFSINSLLSYVWQERRISQPNLPATIQRTNGIGDIVFLLRYRVTNPENNAQIFTVGIGPKLPTGPTDLSNEIGIPFNADMQPGSGSWDVVYWVNYLHQFGFRPSMIFYLTGTYQMTGANHDYLGSQKYELGDNFRIDLGISDRINIGTLILDPGLAIRYRNAAKDENEGFAQTNTGGEWIFLIPSVRYAINTRLLFQVTADLPVYSYLNGSQLTPSYRINTGFYYTFSKKNDELNPF